MEAATIIITVAAAIAAVAALVTALRNREKGGKR